MQPAESLAELNLLELGTARLAFAPNDARPLTGAVAVPPAAGDRYAYVEDRTVVLYSEEQDMSAQFNIEIEQGMTWARTVWWEQDNGEPVDMTGATAKMQIRAEKSTTADHKATLASYSAQGGDPSPWFNAIDIEEEEGKITLGLSPDDTAAIDAGVWYYDLVITLLGGEKHKLMEGRATIDPAVTA